MNKKICFIIGFFCLSLFPSTALSSTTALSWSNDGSQIVISSFDKVAAIVDAKSGNELRRLSGFNDYINALSWSEDSKYIVGGSNDGDAFIWNSANGKVLLKIDTSQGNQSRNPVTAVGWLSDGKRIATGSIDGTAKVWDSKTGKLILTLDAGHYVLDMKISPDGKKIATASFEGFLQIWDSSSGKKILTIDEHNKSPKNSMNSRGNQINSISWSYNGKYIASASKKDKTTRIFDSESGEELLLIKDKHSCRIVSWCPDGNRIFTGYGFGGGAQFSDDEIANIRDIHKGRAILSFPVPRQTVTAAAWSPDGKKIAIGSDSTAYMQVFDSGTGKKLLTYSFK